MLLVIQFPISDARRFSPDGPTRLALPDWPTPITEINPQFTRCFGPAVRRHRGADAAWIDERIFCKADRALRFPGLGKRSLIDDIPSYVSGVYFPLCAFRRLLYDGGAVARVEIGLVHDVPPHWDQQGGLNDTAIFSFVQNFLRLDTVVAQFKSDPKSRPLVQQGRHLAQLYEQASTISAGSGNQPVTGLVESGMPVVIVEYERDEVVHLPKGVRMLDPGKAHGAQLGFAWISTVKGSVATWFISQGSSSEAQLRSLRLCLMRLHAEQEALDIVLRQIRRRRLSFQPGTESGDNFESYLNRATRVVQHDWTSGISQSAVLDAMNAADYVMHPADHAGFMAQLEGVRNQVRRKIEDYQQRRGYGREVRAITYNVNGDLVENNQQIIHGGYFAGNVVNKIAAERMENSLNTVVNSDASPTLKEALTALKGEVDSLVRQLERDPATRDQLEHVANLFETFSEQSIQKRPLKDVLIATGRGLVDVAKQFSEKITPIAQAVSAVLGILGIVGVI